MIDISPELVILENLSDLRDFDQLIADGELEFEVSEFPALISVSVVKVYYGERCTEAEEFELIDD